GDGILLMDTLESAVERDATMYAAIEGNGSNGDAIHNTAPDEEGEGAAPPMQQAINDAGCELNEIDYINAHGTSTEMNDKIETAAIKEIFGDHAYELAVSSTKSMTGHLLGAAGGVEGVLSVKSIAEGILPP